MAIGRDQIKKIKGALLIIGILVLGSVVGLFALHQQNTPSGQPVISSVKENVSIALESVRHTAIKEGVKDWSIVAGSADYRLDEKKADFRKLQVTFYDKDGSNVHLSADSGTWEIDSNDLVVAGNVMIKDKEYEFRTEALTYVCAKRMFETRSPVSIHGFSLDLKADGMNYYLDTGQVYLNRDTAGAIE